MAATSSVRYSAPPASLRQLSQWLKYAKLHSQISGGQGFGRFDVLSTIGGVIAVIGCTHESIL